MRQRVEFVEELREVKFLPVPDHYRLRPRGRFLFLQRWAWQFLQWRGALEQAVDQHVTVKRHVIDTQDVMQRLMKQRKELFSFRREPRELLIGSEDFEELMGHSSINAMMSFNAEYSVGGHSYDQRIMGLKITVVPWMRGMLVMP